MSWNEIPWIAAFWIIEETFFTSSEKSVCHFIFCITKIQPCYSNDNASKVRSAAHFLNSWLRVNVGQIITQNVLWYEWWKDSFRHCMSVCMVIKGEHWISVKWKRCRHCICKSRRFYVKKKNNKTYKLGMHSSHLYKMLVVRNASSYSTSFHWWWQP
jgi:hypothetical protein